jgi:hypothetical protein
VFVVDQTVIDQLTPRGLKRIPHLDVVGGVVHVSETTVTNFTAIAASVCFLFFRRASSE